MTIKLTAVHKSRDPWMHQCKYTGTDSHLSKSDLGSTSWICKHKQLKWTNASYYYKSNLCILTLLGIF